MGGTCVFVVTQIISQIITAYIPMAFQWRGHRPFFADCLSFLLHPASNMLTILLSFSKQLTVFSVLSRSGWITGFVDLAGWIFIAGFIIKRREEGKSFIPLSIATQSLILRRFKMLGSFVFICVVFLGFAGILFFIACWADPLGFDGQQGLDAVGFFLKGKAHTNVLATTLCVVASICALFGIYSVWCALYIFFTGHSHAYNYLCPYCGDWLQMGRDFPDPDTLFKCPQCGQSIRRDSW